MVYQSFRYKHQNEVQCLATDKRSSLFMLRIDDKEIKKKVFDVVRLRPML
jgi:hypothetical protein